MTEILQKQNISQFCKIAKNKNLQQLQFSLKIIINFGILKNFK